MPRFVLTALEQTVLEAALTQYAREHRLLGGTVLVAAASTTMTELKAIATQYLAKEKAKLQAVGTALPEQLAAIDSALAKL